MNTKHPEIRFGKTGILLINLGTPDSTSWLDIRKYLKEFLSDKRVIEVPPFLWQIILNVFILNLRPSKTAKAYKEIWMKEENISPLLYYTREQSKKISNSFKSENVIIDFAMRYGNPSIKSKLYKLKEDGCENIVILPLYPQYAAATTATVCDEVYRSLMGMRWQPSLQIIPHYESDPMYIDALINSIENKIKEINWKPDLILSSYHGIPKSYFDKGDPYQCYCQKTTRLMKEKFKSKIPIITTFQSRFGPAEWLTPYTEEKLIELAKGKNKKVMLICPGFSSDCIETIEEIGLRAKEVFIKNGGKKFALVSCLNDNNDHINLLKSLIERNI